MALGALNIRYSCRLNHKLLFYVELYATIFKLKLANLFNISQNNFSKISQNNFK